MIIQAIEIPEDEYLIREPQLEYKSEYRNGKMVAMSGASPAHVRLVSNLIYAIRRLIEGKPCEAFVGDMRVKVAAAHFYTYPDLAVVCGDAKFDKKDPCSLVNPTLLIEVLSPSTEKYDRCEKFGYFKKLDALQEYVLVSQDKVQVEVFSLMGGQWASRVYCSIEDSASLLSIGCELAVRPVYERVL